MKTELLVKAAKELDKVLYEEPYIDFKQKPDELTKAVMEASKELESDDKLSEETIDILAQIWEGKEGKLTVKVCEIFRELGILPPADEKEEQEEDAVVVSAGEDLVNEIDDAERIKDLKDIAKSNDEFKLIRGKLNGYKEIDDLRDAMLEILDGVAPEETEPEEKPKAEKKEEPKVNLKIVPKDDPKEEKKVGKPKVEKKPASIISRSNAIAQAVNILCKSGATMQEIMEKGDTIYAKAIGKTGSAGSGINRYFVSGLVEFDILVKDNQNYKFKK